MDYSFTIFIVAYYKLDFLIDSINSVLNQDYENYELIIVDNGSKIEVKEYIELIKNHKKIKVINYNKNQFSWDDPLLQIEVCWNKALSESKSDYIMHLGYDDRISPNLLKEYNKILKKKKCLTIAPNLKEIDRNGLETNLIAMINKRPEVTQGKEIAMSIFDEHSDIKFIAPGEIFTIETEYLKKYGGYHRNVEMDHLFGIVPFGLSGFAKNAFVYWRRHGENLGNELPKRGMSVTSQYQKWLNDKNIMNLWGKEFSLLEGQFICKGLINKSIKYDCLNIAENFYDFNIAGAFKIYIKIFRHSFVYIYIWMAFYHRKSSLFKKLKII